jgi:hypothetical protein
MGHACGYQGQRQRRRLLLPRQTATFTGKRRSARPVAGAFSIACKSQKKISKKQKDDDIAQIELSKQK